MRWILVFPLTLIVVLMAIGAGINAGLFQSQLEGELTKALNAQVKLGPLRLVIGWPLEIRVGPSQIVKDGQNLTWSQLEVHLSRVVPPFAIRVRVDQMNVKLPPPSPTPSSKLGQKSGATESKTKLGPPIQLIVELKQASIEATQGAIRNLDLTFKQKVLLRSSSSLQFKAMVESPQLPTALPISVHSEALTLTLNMIKTTAMQLEIGGLRAQIQGTSLIDENRHRWTATITAPDLAKLPQAPIEIPAKNWRGAMQGHMEFIKEANRPAWSIEGELKAQNMSADLDWRSENLTVRGPFQTDFAAKITYDDRGIVIPTLTGQLNMAAAEVIYPGVIQKKAGIPLNATWNVQGNTQHLKLNKFEVNFWKIALQANGQIETRQPFVGQLAFGVPRVSLVGLETVVIPLGKSAVRGEIEMRGRMQGPLAEWKKSDFYVEAMRFHQVAAHLSWKSPTTSVEGPVQASVLARGDLVHGEVKTVQGSGDLSLDKLAFNFGPMKKTAGQPLSLRFNVRDVARRLEITQMDLRGFFGNIQVGGQVESPLTPVVKNLRIRMTPLDLRSLRISLKDFADSIPPGTLNGELVLNGSLPSDRPWFNWPMTIQGSLQLNVPHYLMVATPPTASSPSAGAGNPAAPPPAPTNDAVGLLPKGALTSALELKLTGSIGQLKKDGLVIQGMQVNGSVHEGVFKGDVNLAQIFSGRLKVTALQVPLLMPRPVMQGNVEWGEVDLQQALAFMKPEYQGFASGRMQGQSDFVSYLPNDPAFIQSLRSKGVIHAAPARLSTVKVGEAINSLIKKVPVIKIPPVKVEPINGKIRLIYELKTQTMIVQKFTADDVGGDHLELHGSVKIQNMEGDLNGEFLWSKPTVKGCFLEGNSDAQGRMVIPVGIKGSLMQPSYNVLADLIAKMGAKALKCEQNKVLTEQVGKKLKDLFKK